MRWSATQLPMQGQIETRQSSARRAGCLCGTLPPFPLTQPKNTVRNTHPARPTEWLAADWKQHKTDWGTLSDTQQRLQMQIHLLLAGNNSMRIPLDGEGLVGSGMVQLLAQVRYDLVSSWVRDGCTCVPQCRDKVTTQT